MALNYEETKHFTLSKMNALYSRWERIRRSRDWQSNEFLTSGSMQRKVKASPITYVLLFLPPPSSLWWNGVRRIK